MKEIIENIAVLILGIRLIVEFIMFFWYLDGQEKTHSGILVIILILLIHVLID